MRIVTYNESRLELWGLLTLRPPARNVLHNVVLHNVVLHNVLHNVVLLKVWVVSPLYGLGMPVSTGSVGHSITASSGPHHKHIQAGLVKP
jgi:hypothetical protein